MTNDNFISPRSLSILFGNNDGQITTPPIDLDDWINQLPPALRRPWNVVRDIPRDLGTEPANYKFHYDRTRFNPFQLEQNFSKAVGLLDECYALKDDFQSQDARIRDQKAALALSEKLLALEEEELAELRQTKTLGGSSKAIYDDTIVPKQLVADDAGNEALFDLSKRKLDIRREETKRLKRILNSWQEPQNPYVISSRVKAMYAHRFNELVMTIEAVKHGLFILKGKAPYQLETFQDYLNRAADQYFRYRVLGAEPASDPEPDPAPDPNPDMVEPETVVRQYLWDTAVLLQQGGLKNHDFVVPVSLKNQLKKENRGSLNAAIINYDGGSACVEVFVDPKDLGYTDCRLIGVNATLLIKEGKGLKKYTNGNDRVYDIILSKRGYVNTPIEFTVFCPEQYLGNKQSYGKQEPRSVSFFSNSATRSQASGVGVNQMPVLHGKNIVENFRASGRYNVCFKVPYFPESDRATIIENIADIVLFLHVKTNYAHL